MQSVTAPFCWGWVRHLHMLSLPRGDTPATPGSKTGGVGHDGVTGWEILPVTAGRHLFLIVRDTVVVVYPSEQTEGQRPARARP